MSPRPQRPPQGRQAPRQRGPATRDGQCGASCHLHDQGLWWDWRCSMPAGHSGTLHRAEAAGYRGDDQRVYAVEWTEPEYVRQARTS